jgi:(E)-2-((N-methylformamido)methylene)succinate hydrolase
MTAFENFTKGPLTTRWQVVGSGPAVALIHGVGGRLEDWNGVVERLSAEFRMIRYDLRGLGQSSKLPGPYGVEDFSDDLAALLDHVGVAACHVAGFSLGGLVAQSFALRYAAKLKRLALLSTVAGRTDDERERVLARLKVVQEGVSGAHFENSVDRWFTPTFQRDNPDIMEYCAERNRSNDSVGYAATYGVLATTDLHEDLHQIAAPTLVATGEGDQGSNPRMARLMHAYIPNAKLRILPNLRHSILIEAPDVVANLLREAFQGGE